MVRKKGKGYYSISAVAEMFSVHQQTIRMYEKEGLISPNRSEGNTRLFTDEDIERLDEIIYLTHKMGINLAGVEMILKLKRHIKKLQKEVNTLFKQATQELETEADMSQHIIESSIQRLAQLKKSNTHKTLETVEAKTPVLTDNQSEAPRLPKPKRVKQN